MKWNSRPSTQTNRETTTKNRLRLSPSLGRCLLCDLLALGWRELLSSRLPAFNASEPSQGDSGGILASIRIGNIDLSCSHVNDEFGELVGVAWTFAFADCHEPMMPQAGRIASTL